MINPFVDTLSNAILIVFLAFILASSSNMFNAHYRWHHYFNH